ncbi:hypothetical protein RF11_05577 [Thelohanellus kitauei]|uniref:Uncharacterized protein n=1 Tax=Thelohanellus kitauei TaxID=669202 RepID=A0A0C2I5T7_THEKT|nr:hypothetical protein RF11_05577 [Thelohanellus kitauei]
MHPPNLKYNSILYIYKPQSSTPGKTHGLYSRKQLRPEMAQGSKFSEKYGKLPLYIHQKARYLKDIILDPLLTDIQPMHKTDGHLEYLLDICALGTDSLVMKIKS